MRLDRAIGQVPDPPRYTERARGRDRPVAEKYPLHAAVDDEVASGHGHIVMPANAGIQSGVGTLPFWVPACAGMTGRRLGRKPLERLKSKILRQIAPPGICSLDQTQLPRTVPLFELLFADDRRFHLLMDFEPDETFDPVCLAKAAERFVPVLVNASDQVRGDADIERAVTLRSKDVDAGRAIEGQCATLIGWSRPVTTGLLRSGVCSAIAAVRP